MVTKVSVSGILLGSAGIPYPRPDDSRNTPKLGVGSPESPQGKSRRLVIFCHRCVNRRHLEHLTFF